MYLKSIDIQGFKSFAQKTTLDFLPPKDTKNSITVVVGPNGSGKSNISDAIRWVMGEQSMKQLRGKKGYDVIFSGSEGKGQMSMASVMMTLDNSDGRADIDYDELVIGRKYYRDGESEYIINGKSVRLLDLQLLLAKAQFGQGSYAVIGQGMIDRLLLQSPQERKDFFDEASGIKEFQIKRHQAALRLDRTDQNLTQADLLLNEISPRLKLLSRQVKKLEQRQELEVELKELQDQYYVTLWQHHQSHIDALRNDIFDLADELKTSQTALDGIQQELASLAHEGSRQSAYAKLQRAYQEAQEHMNTLERECALLDGKLHTEYSRSGHQQLGWLETKVADLKRQQKKLGDEVEELSTQKKIAEAQIDDLRATVDDASVHKASLKGEISSLETELLRLKSVQSEFHITGFQAVQAVLEAGKRLGDIHGVVAQLGQVDKKYHMALDVAAGGSLASIVVGDEDDARSCVEYLRSGRFGVATFLPLSKIKARPIPGFVHDMLRHPKVHGLARDLVSYKDRYEDIYSFVFGSTIVVEDFAAAKEIGVGRVRMVTLDGDLFETSGAVKGGHRQIRQHGISFAGGSTAEYAAGAAEECEQTISFKHDALSAAEKEYDIISSALREKESHVGGMLNKAELLVGQKHTVDSELGTLEQELTLSQMSPEQVSGVMQSLAKTKSDLEKQIRVAVKEVEKAANHIDSFNSEEEQKKQRVFALQDAMQEEQKKVNAVVEKKNTKQVDLAKYETKQEDLQSELYQEIHTSIQLILDRGIAPLSLEALEDTQNEIQKRKYKLSLIGGIDEEVVAEYEETRSRHEGLSAQLDDLKKAHTDLTKLITELDSLMKKKRGKAFKQIQKEFTRYFSILFEGGKAELVEVYGTEDAADDNSSFDMPNDGIPSEEVSEGDAAPKKKQSKKILQGIDINASPPGKKIKHLQALSGGERTMTSIALMCAILKTNPSPFVVLDEVEAALDEANTLRVVNILQDLSKESQFIIITHNRATMHAADALYGVTMGQDGISHLLSVKMENA